MSRSAWRLRSGLHPRAPNTKRTGDPGLRQQGAALRAGLMLLQDRNGLLFRLPALLQPVLPFRLRENSGFPWWSLSGVGQRHLYPTANIP